MRSIFLYVLLLASAVAAFFCIDAVGQGLVAPDSETVSAKKIESPHEPAALVHVLLTLTAVVAAGWLLGRVCRYIGQPPVIGEVVAGIALGPSLLGRVWPDATQFLLPAESAPYLAVIAQLGVILYMFLIGLEFDPGFLKDRARGVVTIASSSVVVPFALGAALAPLLHAQLSSSAVSLASFTLFLGVAMSITAFPVLARILSDLKLQKTPLGLMTLACAAVGDAAAWCLLALVVGVAQAQVQDALFVIGLSLAYIAAMFLGVRPAAKWLLTRSASANVRSAAALLFVGMLLSALTTEAIGIHAIFGAFLFGAIIPHDNAVARDLIRKLEDTVTVLLLPAFFAFTGMRTEIGLVSGVEEWLLCGLIIAVATIGKFGGAAVSARLTGHPWRESCALGALMNSRGLVELIVLNIGLDLKIISPTLFAMMVLMALVTTIATTPLLQAIGYSRPENVKL